jgi:hypothetical protein
MRRDDQIIPVTGDATPEGAILTLMSLIAYAEGVSFEKGVQGAVTKEWILDTYRECRQAVTDSGGTPKVTVTRFADEEGKAI